jgi:hypothetical protein
VSRRPKILLAIIAVVVVATLTGSDVARAVVAHAWAPERFARCTSDPRLYCEPGSERFARSLAPLVPAAMAQVEAKQGGLFQKPVKIYVYSTVAAYTRYSGTQGGAGSTSFGEIHLAPVMQAVPEQHLALVTHELSHLHLVQRIGAWRMYRLPHWFTEGWATLVSDGGGVGLVTKEQATFALLHGRHFTPPDGKPLLSRLSPTRGGESKIGGPMYYRQASLLVDYLQRRDAQAFLALVRAIEKHEAFAQALQEAYGQALPVLWKDFLVDLSHRLRD